MNLYIIKKQAGQFLTDNATTILTAAGVVGTVATAVLTSRATIKALEVVNEKEKEETLRSDRSVTFSKSEQVKIVWPYFLPPVLSGTATIGAIVMANRMSAQRAAALAAAYGLAEGRLKEFQDKVAEKLTGPKNQQLRDEIAQDRVNANPPAGQILMISGADVLCYDMYSDRYFQSTMETIKKAENDMNGELFHVNYASLSAFYDKIGLKPTRFSDEVGWNLSTTGSLDLRFSSVVSPEGKPCLSVEFIVPPQPDYTRLY